MRWQFTVTTLGLAACLFTVGCKKTNTSNHISTAKNGVASGKATQSTKPSTAATPELRCYEDLCHQELSVPEMMIKAATPSAEQQKYYQTHLAPLVNKVIAGRTSEIEAQLATFKAHESEYAKAPLNDTQKRIIKTVYLLLSPDVKEDVRKQVNEKVNSTLFSQAYALSLIKGPEGYFSKLYPDKSLLEAARSEAQYLMDAQKKINTEVKGKIVDVENAVIRRLLGGESVETSALQKMVVNSYGARLLETLAFSENDITGLIPLSDDDIRDLYRTSQVEGKLKSKIILLPQLQSMCAAEMFQAMNLYPQKSEIENFKQLGENVRGKVLETLSPQDPAYAVVQKAKIYPATDLDTAVKEWSALLNDESEEAQRNTAQASNMDSSASLTLAVILGLTQQNKIENCLDLVDLKISDATNTLDTGIRASWISIRQPSYGAGILAHEFGHLVSRYSNQFASRKQCLKDNQNSEVYTEEDFADHLAGQVLLRMENELQGKKVNYGCLLTSNEALKSLLNADKNDVHSSGLYRAVQLNLLMKKALPESCQTLAEQTAPQALKTCE